MIITLKRAGTCRQCGADLKPGSRAKWYRNGAVYGLDCHADEHSTRRDTAPHGRRVPWTETKRKLDSIEYRRNCAAWSGAHSPDPQVTAAYKAALASLEAESDQVRSAYYRSNPDKAGHLSAYCRQKYGLDAAPAESEIAARECGTDEEIGEDYPCSDRGYEDRCAEATR
jgi:hypothetical protein